MFDGSSRLPLWSLIVSVFAASCSGSAGPRPTPALACAAGGMARAGVVTRVQASPVVATVTRDGDPLGGVAVAVALPEARSAVAVAAVLEARLGAAGFSGLETRVDGLGLRVEALVDSPGRVYRFPQAVSDALGDPVAPSSPEAALVASRLSGPRLAAEDRSAPARVAACRGELAALPADTPVDEDPGAPSAWLAEALRSARDADRIAFGAAGPRSLVEELSRGSAAVSWSRGLGRAPDEWPLRDTFGVGPRTLAQPRSVRVDAAFWVDRADAAAEAVRRLGAPESPLVARLSALPLPFRFTEGAAVARIRGGCVAVVLEGARAKSDSMAPLVDAAAAAVAVMQDELARQLAPPDQTVARGAGDSMALAVRGATDPREAAALAAWWAYVEPSAGGGSPVVAVSVSLPPGAMPSERPRGSAEPDRWAADASRRLESSFRAARADLTVPVLEHREVVEAGQGELWVLLASPCGLGAESSSDAGATALSVVSRALAHDGAGSVALEPWVTPDAVGVLAHAPRRAGERPEEHAARVGERAARALLSPSIDAATVSRARPWVLSTLAQSGGHEGRALFSAASLVAPEHPSWIAPLGSWDVVLRAGPDGLDARWRSLRDGPLRLAVLADEEPEQVEAAVRAADRWIVRRPNLERACPPEGQAVAARAGSLSLEAPSGTSGRALWLAPAPEPGPSPSRRAFELAATVLGESDGLLERALGAPPLGRVSVRLLGGRRAAALAIEATAPDDALDAVISKIQAELRRVRAGGLSQAELDRARARADARALEARLDPRGRLVELWGGDQAARDADPDLSLSAWTGWIASGLSEDRLVLAVTRPKR